MNLSMYDPKDLDDAEYVDHGAMDSDFSMSDSADEADAADRPKRGKSGAPSSRKRSTSIEKPPTSNKRAIGDGNAKNKKRARLVDLTDDSDDSYVQPPRKAKKHVEE